MRVTMHAQYQDPDQVVTRAKKLGVTDVCLTLAGVPGFAESGVPDRAALGDFVSRLADAGVRVPVVIDWLGNDPDVVLNPAAHRATIDAKRATFGVLGQVGISTDLHYIDLADAPRPDDDARYWDGLIRVMRELVAAAEASDVRIANHAIWRCLPDDLREEALSRGVTMAQYRNYHRPAWGGPYLMTTGADVKRLIDAVPSTHHGACFCTGMHIMGGDVPALVDTFKGRIFYSQARDLRGRWPAAQEVFLGEGELDFARILRLLHGAGYAGTVGPEHLGHPRKPGEDLEAAAIHFVQDKLAQVGAQG